MARIDDGHATTIAFATSTFTLLFEKEVTPPGVSSGGANDTTVMANTVYRTMSPKSLISMTEMSFTAAFDIGVYSQAVAGVGINQSITITFPDGATLTFWGWMDEFTPNAFVEGSQPTADVTIIPSNQNATLVETAPIYTP